MPTGKRPRIEWLHGRSPAPSEADVHQLGRGVTSSRCATAGLDARKNGDRGRFWGECPDFRVGFSYITISAEGLV